MKCSFSSLAIVLVLFLIERAFIAAETFTEVFESPQTL
jgi:hypothetical protein